MGPHAPSDIIPTAPSPATTPVARRTRLYPWIVFVLTFGLLLSDYMSRQVLSAVFPLLKAEWTLSDTHLATLNSVVALMVGLLTLPLSVLADRRGRVRSLIIMAVLWSVATLLCAVVTSYEQMLGARFLLGVGEAAYGSVGIAVVLGVFAPRRHAALGGAFMAGGSFGSVLGVALGGLLAVHLGWRWSFVAMAVFGLLFVALFAVLVTERRLSRHAADPSSGAAAATGTRAPLSSLFTNPPVWCAYIGSGLQMFTAAVLLTWTPSFFTRYYDLGLDRAAGVAALFVLLVGTGMVVCGALTDRVGRTRPQKRWTTTIAYCTVSPVCLVAGFQLAPGPVQLILIGIGSFFAAGSSGPTAALVAGLTHSSVRASAMGTLTVANNILGLALGPFVVGVLADHLGLRTALTLAPLAYLGALTAFAVGRHLHSAGLRTLHTVTTSTGA
ncbi:MULTISPECIES: MFS transporter [unclassified Pseudonocardia]|uniref:MFS transporter n=1 Tax=unclassified Pseudonocardia TaxID=2619320 RepID=UPI0001FFEF2C|nr:MFS transporter [Pseudonocardia sp. Ae707_Ps1]OLM17344.1 Transporter, MFS superfamily [Pseudonocardia sp. Ae707_Ps1]